MGVLRGLLNSYLSFTKFGIVLFVLVVGCCGYALGMPAGRGVDFNSLIVFLVGLYCLSSGSLALNQVQEIQLDSAMKRTQKRPLVKGVISPWQGAVVSILLILVGLFFLALLNLRSFYVGLATILLYNGLYTYLWKKKWMFGAVPGAIPGAMPPVIGYMAHSGSLWTDPQLFYLFGLLFLWQMPHFWIIAIKFKEDYGSGGIPVLPLKLGNERTRFHMGLYLFCYLGLACGAPLYVTSNLIESIIIWVFAALVLFAFIAYLRNEKKWLPFFLLLNFSILIFSMVPAIGTGRYYL